MKKFDLNIEEVLDHWETPHALREIIANALDETSLTNTKEPEIFPDLEGNWHIKDFGRGLRYEHFTQNENKEKLENSKKVIGKFGVGLKDAMATFNRRGVGILIQSKYSDISIEKMSKSGFDDVITLHAIVKEPTNPNMVGTEFIFKGITSEEIYEAKSFFLMYSGETVLEENNYGQLINKNAQESKVYVNGLCVAVEENLLFSYNITSPTKKLLRSLNRERTNVGRSAYSDRMKSILLDSSSSKFAKMLVEDLERVQKGEAHDELQWVDVQLHACRILNDKEEVLFLTSVDMMNSKSKYVSYAQDEGRRIVTIPENLSGKLRNTKDIKGNEMVNLDKYVTEWNENFKFDLVKETELSQNEREVFSYKDIIIKWFPKNEGRVEEILVSNKMRPDDYKGSEASGLWIESEKKILINRKQLRNLEGFAGTLIHELIHAYTNTDDQTIEFENELTNMLGKLSMLIIGKEQIENKKNKFWGIFR